MTNTAQSPTLTLSGGTRLSRFLEPGQAFTIGSDRAASFRIPHPSVAPTHATLLWDGKETRVQDDSGGLGMSVNGERVTSAVLREGDKLLIGAFEFIYRSAPRAMPAAGADPLAVSFRGRLVSEIPLEDGITFGSDASADVRIDDPALLPIHACVEWGEDGFTMVDKGGTGLLANGSFFDRHLLLIGDRLDFGEHHAFVFDGWALRCIPREAGCALTAEHLEVWADGRVILRGTGFLARPGEFVGILGASGAGKTTLLRALLGLTRLVSGAVRLNQVKTSELPDASAHFGHVPQKEIIHLELTGRQALQYAAALRLPARTPAREIDKLIRHLAERLDLGGFLDTRAGRLSGGQLKRLSVAVELLSRPPVLLLDEPTSGLDPDSETQLMRQLRELTAMNCTVICTTHLMENVHLMDSVEILAAAPGEGEPGTTVFRGKPSAAREHFETKDFAGIYQQLQQKKPSEWRDRFEQRTRQAAGAPQVPPEPVEPPPRPRHKRRAAVPVLWRRQWDLLRGDPKSISLLLGQPLLIGLLIALSAAGAKDQSATKMFLACVATFWMACGNAAQELVRERSIFERERFTGLRIGAYLTAKFGWLWVVSLAQAMLLFGMLQAFGMKGSLPWQILALTGTSLAATGIGLLVSSWARTMLQAVLLVPVMTIPQILFSGYVFKAQDWNRHPVPRILSRAFPGFAAQRLVDTSLLWNVRIGNYSDLDDAGILTSYENLCTSLYPVGAWLQADTPRKFLVNEAALYREGRGPRLQVRELAWDVDHPPTFRLGAVYAWAEPALIGLLVLVLWAGVGVAGAAIFLRRQSE